MPSFTGRRRAYAAAALATALFIPLPVVSDAKPAEPSAMQTPAKGGDFNKRLSFETNHYRITFSEIGGHISEFKNRDTAYPRRDGAEIILPGQQIFFAPYLGTEGNTPAEQQQKLANITAAMYAVYTFQKEETADFVKITGTAPILFLQGKKQFPATLTKVIVFLKAAPYFKVTIGIQSDSDLKLTNLMLYALPTIGPKPENPGNFRDYHHYSIGDKFEQVYQGTGGAGGLSCACNSAAVPEKKIPGAADFFGVSSRFLVLNMQPLFQTKNLSIKFDPADANDKNAISKQSIHLNLGDVSVEKKKPAVFEFIGYMGPKMDEKLHPDDNARKLIPELAKFHKNLYKSFDFGITEPIRDIIVSALNLLYKVIPNYGIGIILIALLLKLAFFPLNQKQAEAMKRMGELQPKIKEINERYKNNPQEKQRRIMEMYKTHKVNPVSGCLPMLIQLPVFIAMYSAFSDAYDLWKSPFIPGWIPDLSQPDHVFSLPATLPYVGGFAIHLLPIVMTLTQYYQTKLTPTSGDENQRKIMLLMPFMMLFLFYAMPSGVVLYWTVQNLLSIGQQVLTNRKNKAAAAT